MINTNIITDESSKTKSWMIQVAKDIVSASQGSRLGKETDIMCWNMFNQIFNEDDYNYLTQEGDFSYPAKMRWIGVQRSFCNFLISQQSRRPFPFSVFIEDSEGVNDKYENMLQEYIMQVLDIIKRKVDEHVVAIQAIEQKKQQLMQVLQQEPQDEEQAMQQQQLQQQLPLIESELNHVNYMFEKSLSISSKDLDKLEQMFKYEYKDIKEQIAQKLSVALRRILNTKEVSNKNFVSHIVTGKQYYYVDHLIGEKYPRYERVNEIKVYYPTNTGSEWVEEGPWVAIHELKSYSELVEEYDFTEEQLKKLKNYNIDSDSGNFVSVQGGGAIDVANKNYRTYSGSANNAQNIGVWKIWFKSPRKIKRKKTPNPYDQGNYFSHIVNDEELMKRPANEAKGEVVETRYVNDIYEVVFISEDIVPIAKKKDVIIRKAENYSKVLLPIIGPSFNDLEAPYSLIWNTKDIQILYNIVHYHRELMLAAAGVKGQIIDLAQLPQGMSKEEQAYHRKTGKLYIETVQKGGKRVNSAYNQWKDFDDSVSPSIQYLDGMLMSLKETMGEMMGVTRQRLGVTVPSDQVGTAELARDQSALVTEIIHRKHDEIERRAMVQLLNLAVKYTYKNGGLLQYTDFKEGTEYINIPAEILTNIDFNIILDDSLQEERNLSELRMWAARYHEKGMLPFRELVSIYNIDSLKELEMKLKHFSDKAEELQSQNMQRQKEDMIEIEERKMQLQAEYQQAITQANNEIEMYRVKLEEARLKHEMETQNIANELKNKEIETKKAVELLKIATENEVEGAYLEEQANSNAIASRLQALELQLEAMMNGINLQMQDKSEGNRHTEKMKELDVKKAQIRSKAKEHISDR